MFSALLALSEPSGELLTFAAATLASLAAIIIALINTRHSLKKANVAVKENQAMVIEIHNIVNSQRSAMERRINELANLVTTLGGEVPAPPAPDSPIADVIMTMTGEATTTTGETVAVTGEAIITPVELDQDPLAEHEERLNLGGWAGSKDNGPKSTT